MTAEEEAAKTLMVHKMYLDNEKIELKINELRRERQESEIKFDSLLKSKLAIIDGHRAFINEANDRTVSALNVEM